MGTVGHCVQPHTGEGSQELLYLCRDCRSVGSFASADGVEAVFEICSSSVFAVLVGSAAVVGVASLLCIAACWCMQLLSELPHVL